jgi:hypothetical protein
MTTSSDVLAAPATEQSWLRHYYFVRAVFSVAWVAGALTLGQQNALLGAAFLTAYPLWDAAANYLDATRNGGMGRNRSQAINVVVSSATTLAVLASLPIGLLQLATAVRRWTAGAQWAMALSGGQSALAGTFFILQAQQPGPSVLPTIAGYAGFGAIYFLVSAIWLAVKQARRTA